MWSVENVPTIKFVYEGRNCDVRRSHERHEVVAVALVTSFYLEIESDKSSGDKDKAAR